MDWLEWLEHVTLAEKAARAALWLRCQAPDLPDVVEAHGDTLLANVLPYLHAGEALECLRANNNLLPPHLRGAYLPMVH